MSKITWSEYIALVLDDNVKDQEILDVSRIVKGEGAFDWTLAPDPDKVEMTTDDIAVESAMQLGNTFARARRARRFFKRLNRGDNSPVLVSEGDSWFQFPFYIDEVIDGLEKDFLIWSVGAAGDTASNMVFGMRRKGKTEYIKALQRQRGKVRAFLFSAAGNDVIGEDPDSGDSALFHIIRDYQPGHDSNPHAHINFAAYGSKLDFLRRAYETVINSIRDEQGFESLPIIVHGYDYVFPYPHTSEDPRDPKYASKTEWLGEPFEKRGYPPTELRREIVKVLIDGLYDMLYGVAGDSASSQVWVVDCRGAMPNVADWNDEIHGTSAGFKKVAKHFKVVIDSVI